MPVAIAAAVVVVVLMVMLVVVDESDTPVALVEVLSVVAVESIVMPDMPDIVPMSMPDISMLSLLLEFQNEKRSSRVDGSYGSQVVSQYGGRNQC